VPVPRYDFRHIWKAVARGKLSTTEDSEGPGKKKKMRSKVKREGNKIRQQQNEEARDKNVCV